MTSRLSAILSSSSPFWFSHTRGACWAWVPGPGSLASCLSLCPSQYTWLQVDSQGCCSALLLVWQLVFQPPGTHRDTKLLLGCNFLLSRFVVAFHTYILSLSPYPPAPLSTRDLMVWLPSNRVRGGLFTCCMEYMQERQGGVAACSRPREVEYLLSVRRTRLPPDCQLWGA